MNVEAAFPSASTAAPASENGGARTAPATTRRWSEVRAQLAELMLVGGATLVLLPLAWLLRWGLGLDAAEYAVGFTTFYAAYVINDPHFAVTYLLFYKDARQRAFGRELPRAQRFRYLVAGALVPAALVGWAVAALAFRSAQSLGWMVQLMFLLVGWHYVKQGFGVLTVLSARRGVRISPRERAVILAHCVTAWAYAWASPAIAAGDFEEKGIVYRAPAHPRWLELVTLAPFVVSTVALLVLLGAKWRREKRTLPLVPLGGLLITVWSWTIYSSIDPLLRYAIPALHSIQYLYFVWLLRRNEAREGEGPPSFGRPVAVRVGALAVSALLLGCFLFHGGPAFLDGVFVVRAGHHARDPGPLGETPFFAAIFVIVNIHHYFMDNVIWRRDNPEMRYLVSSPRARSDAD
jgi:hypothetical protein